MKYRIFYNYQMIISLRDYTKIERNIKYYMWVNNSSIHNIFSKFIHNIDISTYTQSFLRTFADKIYVFNRIM